MKGRPSTLNRLRGIADPGLAKGVIQFARFLKEHGFHLFSSNVAEALRGLDAIDLLEKGDFLNTLRTALVTNKEEWVLFEDLFKAFWEKEPHPDEESNEEGPPEQEGCPEDILHKEVSPAWAEEGECPSDHSRDSIQPATYSPLAHLERKNFSLLDREDIRTAHLILKQMMVPFRLSAMRRFRSTRRPHDMDFRRMMRRSPKVEGLPVELLFRKRKKRLKKLVLLVDTSGSMDRYIPFIMPFILGLKKTGPRAEVFVFSTSLTPITGILRRYTLEKALARIAETVPDWSGGTRIGYSLQQFIESHGRRFLNKRTVAVIISDGWDLGARQLLVREMELLNQKTHRVIWLNPLAGEADYRPICKGMQAALPYVDHFLPCHTIQSLKQVGKIISKEVSS